MILAANGIGFEASKVAANGILRASHTGDLISGPCETFFGHGLGGNVIGFEASLWAANGILGASHTGVLGKLSNWSNFGKMSKSENPPDTII